MRRFPDHACTTELERAERQIIRLQVVVDMQADVIAAFVDRRIGERRREAAGIGAVPGIDRRRGERRQR